MFAVNTLGSNLKLLVANLFPSLVVEEKDYAKINMGYKFKFLLEETGYMHIQATKPDTVGKKFHKFIFICFRTYFV